MTKKHGPRITMSNNRTLNGQCFHGILNAEAFLWMCSWIVLLMEWRPILRKQNSELGLNMLLVFYVSMKGTQTLEGKICDVMQLIVLKIITWKMSAYSSLPYYWEEALLSILSAKYIHISTPWWWDQKVWQQQGFYCFSFWIETGNPCICKMVFLKTDVLTLKK